MNSKIEWKWTFGPKYEKSIKIIRKENTENTSNLAFQQSLLSENDVWSMEEQQVFVSQQQYKEDGLNKRENTYHKMAEREMIAQIGTNPFTNNYSQDVSVQDNFLKPQSTTYEK